MNENIERKVDMLISGMKLPKKKTRIRRRVATIAISLLIAIAIIASASLIDFYYIQTATDLDIQQSAIVITITEPDGVTTHDAPWQEYVTPLGTIYADGDTYIYPPPIPVDIGEDIPQYYTITNNGNTETTVYIDIDVTERPVPDPLADEGKGLTVKVWDLSSQAYVDQFVLGNGYSPFAKFQIHVTADPLIDVSSTYGYTITMDWEDGGG